MLQILSLVAYSEKDAKYYMQIVICEERSVYTAAESLQSNLNQLLFYINGFIIYRTTNYYKSMS